MPNSERLMIVGLHPKSSATGNRPRPKRNTGPTVAMKASSSLPPSQPAEASSSVHKYHVSPKSQCHGSRHVANPSAWRKVSVRLCEENPTRVPADSHSTPARAWLSLIFSTTPDCRPEWNRTIRMPFTEKLDFRPSGMDLVGKNRCVMSKFKTSKEARQNDPEVIDAERVQTLESFSMSSLRDADKKGYNWFSRDFGFTMKAEMSSQASVSLGGTIVSARFSWETALTNVGKAGPMEGPALSPDWAPVPAPVETKQGGTSTAVAGPPLK